MLRAVRFARPRGRAHRCVAHGRTSPGRARPRGSAPLAAALLALAVALTHSHRARANAPAPFVRKAGNEGGAFVARPTSLLVEHEDLSFRCDGDDCAFQAVYHVLNPTDAREEVLGAFYGIRSDALTAPADGADARRTLSPEQLRAIDDAVAVFDPDLAHDDVTRQGFFLGVDAHARATLVFAGHMLSVVFDTRSDILGEFGFPPLETRHLWLGTQARRDTTDEYAYALSPIRSWAGSPSIDVTVRCPSARFWAADQPGWIAGDDGGTFVARRTIAASDASTLRFRVVHPGTTVLNGGPMVGLGGRLDAGEFRGRLGYEGALPWWVIWSASVETNFKGTTTIVPLGEVATPDIIFLIPSLGLGAGVPVQIRSGAGTHVGARMQLTVSFPVLSMVLPVDVFPGASSDVWQVGLFGQASF